MTGMISMRSFATGEPEQTPIIGWDVGGVNLKAARVAGERPAVALEPFELQRAPASLGAALSRLAHRIGGRGDERHAVTMTAELSQYFRTKRAGVSFVLDAFGAVADESALFVFGTDARFHSPAAARATPLLAAASNWMATAALVAQSVPEAIVIDTGSTTTDIIPVTGGRVAAQGRTDPERLQSGELVYTGAVRTAVEAVVHRVPLRHGVAGVSAEGFALTGDAYVWLGRLRPEDYTVRTPDGRPASREFAAERLARVVCADREILDETDIERLAAAVANAQIEAIAAGIRQVRARHPGIVQALVAGLGDFIAAEAAERCGLTVSRLADRFGTDASRAAPAAAVAHLLFQSFCGKGR
jgi:probable H4MPT-linked C1 transfer pathway protein